MTKLIWSVPLILLLGACGTDAEKCDTGSDCVGDSAVIGDDDDDVTNTDTEEACPTPTVIDSIVLPGCDDDTNWVYEAETCNWTDGNNIVNAWETGNANGWNEEHPLDSIDFGANESWDLLSVTLTDEADVASFTEGVSTVFQCGVHDVDPVMSYAIRVTDIDGNISDCAVFATDPSGLDAVFAGTAPNLGGDPTNPEQINAADCTVFTL